MEVSRVRRLEYRDIDDAIALTDLEAWGYTRVDFRRLLALSPDGCFAAELDGRLVGVLTTTTYDGLAFLGAVIVRPDLRGKGVGKQMMEVALDYLQSHGVETVRLNAYLRAIPFYERLGFHGEYDVVRWTGAAAAGRTAGVRPVRPGDVSSVASFDARFFGANRAQLLERLAEEFPDVFLMAVRGGRVHGFIVGNPSGDSCEIGPWVVEPDSPGVAGSLFQGVVAASGSRTIAFSGPSSNDALQGFVKRVRLEEVFRTRRMWYGRDAFPADPQGVWALAGLEKG